MPWMTLNDSKEISQEKEGMYFNSIADERKNGTELEINLIVNELLSTNSSNDDSGGNWLKNSSIFLSNWQKSQLENVRDSEPGIRCLLNSWLVTQKDLAEGTYCNATWDNMYCWPPTPLGASINRTCIEAFTDTQPLYAPQLEGHGYKVCQANGSWPWGNWTNYTECADSYDELIDTTVKEIGETQLVTSVQYILFFGSILSLVCLLSAVTIFYYFRVLRCDRVTIHTHLMLALILRYVMLLIITEPHILKREIHYRSVDMLCKGILIVYLYAMLTSVSWMFIQGIYINGKLTTNVFNGETPFKVYYTIGWLLPFVLMTIWATIMHFNHDVHCWIGYAQLNEIWIIISPIIFALIVNFLFLINILRVMLTKVRTPVPNSDIAQLRRAAKATIFLFPLLGITNLLFLYNPGGDLHKYFVILNTFFGSTQGILVAIGYCYMNKDVRGAFGHVYRRFMARRNANLISSRVVPRNAPSSANVATLCVVEEQPVNNCNNRQCAKLVLRSTELSPNNCGDHRSSQISQSSFKNSPCLEIVNLPGSPSGNSAISDTSDSSCRIFINTTNNSIGYHRVYSSCRSSEGSSLLVSPEHPWSSCGNAIESAAEMLGSRQSRNNV